MRNIFLKSCMMSIPGLLALGVVIPQAQAVVDFDSKSSENAIFNPIVNTNSNIGAGFTIPDDNVTGASSNINISDNSIISNVTVTLNGLNHTYAGDLTATLTHLETSTSVDLFNRPGRVNNFGYGYSSDLDGNFSFDDSFVGDYDVALATLPKNSPNVLFGGNYAPNTAESVTNLLAAFNGESANGTWQLNISDNAAIDVGSLESWELGLSSSFTALNSPDRDILAAPSVPFEFSPSLGILLVSTGFGLKYGRDNWRKKQDKIDLS